MHTEQLDFLAPTPWNNAMEIISNNPYGALDDIWFPFYCDMNREWVTLDPYVFGMDGTETIEGPLPELVHVVAKAIGLEVPKLPTVEEKVEQVAYDERKRLLPGAVSRSVAVRKIIEQHAAQGHPPGAGKGWTIYCEGYNKTTLDTPTTVLGYGALLVSGKVRQDFISTDGWTRFSRVCTWVKDKASVGTCGQFVKEKLTSPGPVRDINTMILFGKYRESLVSMDGKKIYGRECSLDFNNTSISGCTTYQTFSTQATLAGGISGYAAFPYKDSYGRTAIQQFYLGLDGRTPQVGSCVAQSSTNIACKTVF